MLSNTRLALTCALITAGNRNPESVQEQVDQHIGAMMAAEDRRARAREEAAPVAEPLQQAERSEASTQKIDPPTFEVGQRVVLNSHAGVLEGAFATVVEVLDAGLYSVDPAVEGAGALLDAPALWLAPAPEAPAPRKARARKAAPAADATPAEDAPPAG